MDSKWGDISLVKEIKNNVNLKPIISICITTYNHEFFIEKCIDSVLSQKINVPLEILIGEDNSSDKTREICEKYAKKHPNKIRLFLHDRKNLIKINNHPSGRFNFVYNINHARGKYIALLDGDDFWISENKLQKQLNFMESHPSFSICYHNHDIVNKKNEFISNSKNYRDYSTEELLIAPHINTSTSFFRNELEYPLKFKEASGADIIIWHLSGFKGMGKCIPNIKSAYRIHDGGLFTRRSNQNTLYKNYVKGHILILENLPKNIKPLMLQKIQNRINFEVIRQLFKFNLKGLKDTLAVVKKYEQLSIVKTIFLLPFYLFKLTFKR